MLLECRHVTKRFGQLTAVHNLSFEVQKGEIFGIAGPNGAGKTTLYNLITGVYANDGQILFQDEDISRMGTHQICHRGIVRTFQAPQLFASLSVYQNVKVGAHFGDGHRRNEEKAIRDAIAFVGLESRTHHIASNLNLLDKKLTMIAACLATGPKLLLLDEPIAGLSPSEIRQAITIFKRINRALGLSIIIIEHIMKVLIELSQRLMILENGCNICIGPPVEVTGNKKVIDCYLGENYA